LQSGWGFFCRKLQIAFGSRFTPRALVVVDGKELIAIVIVIRAMFCPQRCCEGSNAWPARTPAFRRIVSDQRNPYHTAPSVMEHVSGNFGRRGFSQVGTLNPVARSKSRRGTRGEKKNKKRIFGQRNWVWTIVDGFLTYKIARWIRAQ